MELKKMTIDEKEVLFEEGKTVLEVARENDIYIPSLCYHRKTGPAGRCRVCLVEVEGMRGLQTSCSLPAKDGMEVNTHTEEVIDAQKLFVNLLLAGGQHNCLSCEANGDCELQEACYHLGIEVPAFYIPSEELPCDTSSEMIIREPGKCIKCGRCIDGCNKTVVNEVLDFGFRGKEVEVICDDNRPMGQSSCVQCGECLQLCPTGAIIDKGAKGKGRPWELKKVNTVCPYCGVGCQLTLHVDEKKNKIVKVSGVEGSPTNDGMLCVKGRYGFDFVNSKERLLKPLIRDKDGLFKEASWEEAMSYISKQFTEIKEKHGPDAICGLASAKVTNEDNFVFQKFMRTVVGTNSLDHCARL
jgi:formate dehydrogenase major subunit